MDNPPDETPLALHRQMILLVAKTGEAPDELAAVRYALGEAKAAIETMVLASDEESAKRLLPECERALFGHLESARGLANLVDHAIERPAVFETEVRHTLRLAWEHFYVQQRRAEELDLQLLFGWLQQLGGYLGRIGCVPPKSGLTCPKASAASWKDIQVRLMAKRERGEPYVSVRALARDLKCSDATIRKAISKSKSLQGWQVRHHGPKIAPKATSVDATIKNTAQSTEPAPDDLLSNEDVDAIMARLIDQAEPEERAKLNGLNDAKRRELVKTFNDQERHFEPSPLAGRQNGKYSRHVRCHKRA